MSQDWTTVKGKMYKNNKYKKVKVNNKLYNKYRVSSYMKDTQKQDRSIRYHSDATHIGKLEHSNDKANHIKWDLLERIILNNINTVVENEFSKLNGFLNPLKANNIMAGFISDEETTLSIINNRV